MTTKRENILAYVTTALAATAGISSRVYRSRPEAIRREETPCIIVEPVADSADYNTMDFINWTLQFRMTIIQRGTVPDQAADPIYISAYKILMASRTLGGRCQDLVPAGVSYQFDDADRAMVAMSTVFTCTYRTTAADPEV
jgi:hypothetical protein